MEKVNRPNFGLCLDTYGKFWSHVKLRFHIYCVRDNVDNLILVPGSKIFFVQFADAPLLHLEPLQYSRHHRNFPFQGQFALAKFVHTLYSTGYNGPYSLEIFNDEFRSTPSKQIALDGYRSLLLLEARLYEPLLPPPPKISGVQFVEFACTSSEMHALGGFISGRLGFRKIGQHKSKSVHLYSYGETYFMLNCETESYASAFHLQHGASVCAIAISVDDVPFAISRAETLKYTLISQERRGLDDLQLIAVQAPDESLIYLLDATNPTSFLSDFVLISDFNEDYINIKVEYISQVLKPSELDKTVLFYQALFGLEAQPQLFELSGPRGLVRSRLMMSKYGGFRIHLNPTDTESALIEHFLSRSNLGIRHITLGTDDIYATVARVGNSFRSLSSELL